MKYRKLTTEELNKFKYPNLVAEVIETGYSICTLSEHMGYGRREEDDPLIRGKVFGKIEISAKEAFALAGLFNCEYEYLFSDQLSVVCGKSAAYYRHYEINRRIEKDCEIFQLTERLRERMKKEDEFLMLMQIIAELSTDSIVFERIVEVA